MANSELATRISAERVGPRGPVILADAPLDRTLRVIAIEPALCGALLPEGIDCGVRISVERRLALGGPLIVRLGRARLAISRVIAAGIEVVPAGESGSGELEPC
jgi:Fe2+ transport system protein FeoA